MKDYKKTSTAFIFNCPFCVSRGQKKDTGRHLYYYFKDNFLVCFKCGYKKSGVDKCKLEDVLDCDISTVKIEYKKEQGKATVKWVDFDDGILSKMAMNYLVKRDFAYAIESYQIKIGIDELTGFIVFPMYDNGKLVHYVGRRFLGKGAKTWNLPNVSAPLYGYRQMYSGNLILVEGCFDRMAVEQVGYTAFAVLGKSISQRQFSQLSMIVPYINSIGIMLDGSVTLDARKLALELYDKYDLDIRLIVISNKDKDPADLTREELVDCVENYITYPFMIL